MYPAAYARPCAGEAIEIEPSALSIRKGSVRRIDRAWKIAVLVHTLKQGAADGHFPRQANPGRHAQHYPASGLRRRVRRNRVLQAGVQRGRVVPGRQQEREDHECDDPDRRFPADAG